METTSGPADTLLAIALDMTASLSAEDRSKRLVAAVVRALPCDAAWETVSILGKVLDREATARAPEQAQILRDELAKGKDGIDAGAFVAALDAVFPCP